MDWIQSIQKAIAFIENNLQDSDLTSEVVAKQVYSSNVNFSRVFYIMTGLSVAEYIRNRRLSVAGWQLQNSQCSVLDTALNFGYTSPEAFTKAFKRFHGVNPSESKSVQLREFHPMEMHLSLTQKRPLSWKIEQKNEFYLNGCAKWVSGEDEYASAYLWTSCETSGYIDSCYNLAGFDTLVGIYEKSEYTIKAKCNIPTLEDSIKFSSQKWAMFSCEGNMPEAINNTWNKIYSQWMPQSKYAVADLPQLEVYTETDTGYTCEIWIAID